MVEETSTEKNNATKVYDLFSLDVQNLENDNTSVQTIKDPESGGDLKYGAEFEEAISKCGFGKFNILLLLCAMPGYMTAVYVTSILSYILTSAECDLKMTMNDMGALNSIPYAGMLTSAMLWGYLSDTLGRKMILVWGFSALAVCEFISSFSQTYYMLFFLEFLSGFIFNGPFAVLISYISELHEDSVRSKVLVYAGIYYAIGNIKLPLMAWSIIPNDWNIPLFGSYELHSWHVFLAIFAIPPLASGLAMASLPESPKFLMSRGRNEEALEVFKKIYSMNTGKSPDTYPIKSLANTMSKGGEAPRGWAAIQGGFRQLKPLCLPPTIYRLFLVCFLNSGNMLGSNTLRLWFPQIANIIEDYGSRNEESASLCHIMSMHVSNKTIVYNEIDDIVTNCVTLVTADSMYINSLIIGTGTLVVYVGAGFLVEPIGKKKLTVFGLLMSGGCALAVYWTTTYVEVVTLFTIFVSVSGFVSTLLSTFAVELFTTSTRAMAVATFLMIGRLGTVVGGLTFPVLLNIGCFSPFAFIAGIMLVGGLLSLALPNSRQNFE